MIWDVLASHQPVGAREPLLAMDFNALWAGLSNKDSVLAYRALCTLARESGQAVRFLQNRLQPIPSADGRQLARSLRDLDSNQFAVREQAYHELENVKEVAEAALKRALQEKPPLELRRRMEQLLAKMDPAHSSESLRVLRAIEVLEHIDTPAGRQLLERLAQGAPEARLTQEAQASLQRLTKRLDKP
jgi:hypothetical protein